MIEEDDIQAALDAALCDVGTADHRAMVADENDESEMTSVMGPEERRLLQQATRSGAGAAPPEVVREEDFARPTARPPSSGNEPPVLTAGVPEVSTPNEPATEPDHEAAGTPAPVAREQSLRLQHPSRAWSVAAFLLLVAAVVYAVQR